MKILATQVKKNADKVIAGLAAATVVIYTGYIVSSVSIAQPSLF